ncbi:MAG: DNA cytosine methyltransferase [Gemmatimonadaceae bacterium]
MAAATLGTARGNPRYYAQGRYLSRAGFAPGAFLRLSVIGEGDRAALEIAVVGEPTGNRVSAKMVSRKAASANEGGGVRVPVVDLNAPILRQLFGDGAAVHVRVEEGRIVLTRPALDRRIASRLRDGSEGSVFSGGGLLTEAARRAGFTPRFAVEWDERYAAIYEANHPQASMYCMSAHEAAFADLPPVEILTMGIPCEPWSTAARQAKGTGGMKRDRGLPATAHPLGDMAAWAFAIILKVNPRTIVVEEAPGFAASETGYLLRGALERIGYSVDCRVMDASRCGYATKRKRSIMVAQTPDGATSRFVPWPKEQEATHPISDYLDREIADGQWFDRESKGWVFDHADRQSVKGNGFGIQVIDPAGVTVGALKKRMLAGQGDSPVVPHPTRPCTYRWLTLSEMRRFHGVPESYELGDAVTTAGEVVGQGVHVGLFTDVIARATGRRLTADAEPVALGGSNAEREEGAPILIERTAPRPLPQLALFDQ